MKTLFLDVDGTLIDSFPGIRESFLHGLATVGWPIPSEARISLIPGPPMEETFRTLGMPPETVTRALAAYLEHHAARGWSNSQPFSGMRELLAHWKQQGFRLCTATSKGEGFARQSLSEFGMIGYFDFIGAAQEDGPRRTKAAVISHVLDSVGLHNQESEILMIGDRSHDIEGAATFGIDTAAVTWGYGTPEEHAVARFIASDPAALNAVVQDWSTT
ncbi:HAD-IA family hydrolase [Corynebacterium sp. A21]|uniref:HAD-IA family hydrolase n=1 Tax=Corynebacterium sp. A21 TaxID=3457318 RepID=UPI003FD501D1